MDTGQTEVKIEIVIAYLIMVKPNRGVVMIPSIAEMNNQTFILLAIMVRIAIFRNMIYSSGPLQNTFTVTASFSCGSSRSPLGTLWFLSTCRRGV